MTSKMAKKRHFQSAEFQALSGRPSQADDQEAFKWLRRASDAGLPQAKYALARSMLENRIPSETADIESLLVGAAERVNEANLDLAELYMARRDHVKWMEAAVRIQTAYEVALGEDDNALAQRCLVAAPPIIARLEAAHPTMSDGLAQNFVVTRFMFDEKRRPYPSRAVRSRRMADLVRELAGVRGTGSNQKLRLMRELGSNMGGLKAPQSAPRRPSAVLPIVQRIVNGRVGRNDPCPCGSGRKYKQCHA